MKLPALILAAVWGGGFQDDMGKGPLRKGPPAPEVGKDAPDFTLKTLDGAKEVTLSKLRGKPVVLIFGSYT